MPIILSANAIDLGMQIEQKCRAVTRQQNKEIEVDVTEKPNLSNYILLYTMQEMSMFQRQNPGLCLLHECKDNKTLPSRDEVNKYSPSVRRYWLNWENIIRENDILHQKVLIPEKKS
jgi:hypothetical protein